MTAYTESNRPCEGVLNEEEWLSRESLTIKNGTAAFAAGMVLGSTLVSGSATSAAVSGSSGAGTMGTITVGATARVGVYQLVFIEPASGLGNFIVYDPDDQVVGKGVVATEFVGGGLTFTLADGNPDWAVGDTLRITVTGSEQYVPYDDGNTDGSNVARAIALYPADASGGAVTVTCHVRHAEWALSALAWHASADATAKTKAIADLARHNVFIRS